MAPTLNASNCLTNTAPVLLSKNDDCNLGFYCPNNTASNPPQYCPPTIECQIIRLSEADSTCSQPQGIYEPIICEAGYYCPSGGKQKLSCPAGHFCTLGSYEPAPCSPGSICPPNSERQIPTIGLSIIIVLDLLLLVLALRPTVVIHYHRFRRRRQPRRISSVPLDNLACEDISISIISAHHGEYQEAVVEPAELTTLEGPTKEMQIFVESLDKCLGARQVGLSLRFESLELELPSGKKILRGVTGSMASGSMWGVMGASGAGKSTFVNVLMGKIKNTGGAIYVNGAKKNITEYKKIIGYVPQDDIVLPELTVRENILHSARIRMPSDWADQEIQTHVDKLIACLQLSHVQHSLVGDPVKPIISGGQRKRVSIGIELAATPMVLFLDEPTSGLDSSSALSLMKLLHTLSLLGVTVVPIIHQPRTEIFETLGSVMLLAEGQLVYQGKTSAARLYFEKLGFKFQSNTNPADIIMDIISGQGHRHRNFLRNDEINFLIKQWRKIQGPTDMGPNPYEDTPTEEEADILRHSVARRGAFWHKQMYFCFMRSMTQQFRQASGFCLEVFVGAVAGLLIGLSVFELYGILFSGIYRPPYQVLSSALNYTLVPEIGLLCNLAIGLAGSAPGVKIFGEEKLLYWREAASGHSRSAYYTGKVLSTFLRIALSALHFAVFFNILATPLMSFGANYVTVLLYFYCVYGLAGLVSTVTTRENGPLLAVITSLITGVFCGYGPTLAQVQGWHLEWFWRMCPGTWFSEAYFNENLSPLGHLYDIENAAEITGYTLRQFNLDIGMLLVIGTVYRILAFFGLAFMNREKQR